MATKSIDLDALAAELTAAGFSASTYYDDELARTDLAIHITRNGAKLQAITVHANGNMSGLIPNHNDKLWEAISIYRKHVSPVADPAPPAGLLAAAKAYIDARYRQLAVFSADYTDESEWPTLQHNADNIVAEAFDALRREVAAAPASVPVALTDAERHQFADEIVRLLVSDLGKPDPYAIAEERVDAIFAKLSETFELRRRT